MDLQTQRYEFERQYGNPLHGSAGYTRKPVANATPPERTKTHFIVTAKETRTVMVDYQVMASSAAEAKALIADTGNRKGVKVVVVKAERKK